MSRILAVFLAVCMILSVLPTVFAEGELTGKVIEEVEYNDRNRPTRIKKYEWNENGTKAKQYNYLPNGKLYSVKVYEYIFSDK